MVAVSLKKKKKRWKIGRASRTSRLNYKRITEYMKIAELIIEEVLNSIIITFYNNEQEERLKAIIMAEGIFNNEMDMEIERWGEKIIKV